MALILKTIPRGVDIPINSLQNLLYTELDLLSYESYPRVYKNPDVNGLTMPESYVGNKDYKEVFFDDKFSLTSFWLADDNRSVSEFTTTTISVVFQVLLDELYPTIPHRADEEFIRDIYNILYNSPRDYDLTNVITGIDNVYSEFDTSQVTWDDMSNFFVCRFDLEAVYDYNC